ncbi:MAG: hypothetical protein VKO64_04145 [Candidatus Sericytochromatia bacterium]|nr:hypothetical protein [Candidatus Sericytochromatia bacterium]
MSRRSLPLFTVAVVLTSILCAWPFAFTDVAAPEEAVQSRALPSADAAIVSRRARRHLRIGQDVLAAAGVQGKGVHLDWAEQRLRDAGWVVLRQPVPDDSRPEPIEMTSLLALAPGNRSPSRVIALDVAAPEPMGLVTLSAMLAVAAWMPPASSSQPVAWWFASGRERRSLGLRQPPEAFGRLERDPEVWVIDASCGWPKRPIGHHGTGGVGGHPTSVPAGLQLTVDRVGLRLTEQPRLPLLATAVLGLGLLEPGILSGAQPAGRHRLAALGPLPTERTREVLLSPVLEDQAARLAPGVAWLAATSVATTAPSSGRLPARLVAAALLLALPLLVQSISGLAAARRSRSLRRRSIFMMGCLALPWLALFLFRVAAERSDWTRETGRPGIDWFPPDASPYPVLILSVLLGTAALARKGILDARSGDGLSVSSPMAVLPAVIGHGLVALVAPWSALLGTGPVILLLGRTTQQGMRRPLLVGVLVWALWLAAWGHGTGTGWHAVAYALNRVASSPWGDPATAGVLLVAGVALTRALLPVRIGGTRPVAR